MNNQLHVTGTKYWCLLVPTSRSVVSIFGFRNKLSMNPGHEWSLEVLATFALHCIVQVLYTGNSFAPVIAYRGSF